MMHKTKMLTFVTVMNGEAKGPELRSVEGNGATYRRSRQALLHVISYCLPCEVIFRK
jgi:hypothetical protein